MLKRKIGDGFDNDLSEEGSDDISEFDEDDNDDLSSEENSADSD